MSIDTAPTCRCPSLDISIDERRRRRGRKGPLDSRRIQRLRVRAKLDAMCGVRLPSGAPRQCIEIGAFFTRSAVGSTRL